MGLEAFAKEWDEMLRREGGGEESQGEGGEAGAETGKELTPVGGRRLDLSRIAQLILMCDCSVNPGLDKESYFETLGRARGKLAASLGCHPDDLQEIVDSYGESWDEIVLEERVRRQYDSTSFRDVSWDRLEAAVLRKLVVLVEESKVGTVGELLAIAKVANGASRSFDSKKSPPNQPGGGVMFQQNNFGYVPGDPENGVLPSGNLGKIQLNLSHRVHEQMTKTIDHDGQEKRRIIDSVEMIGLDDVQKAVDEEESVE